MITKNLTPAVAYVRMSSDKQDASPDQQRAEIRKLAEQHDCKILREYFDPAISGDATEKRREFLRMVEDAEKKRDFAAILCWDQDRFGRFDSIEAGRWIYPLRKAGVWLLTVAQGMIDWNNFQGRVMYSIVQEGKHQYLIDLSRNVLRGRIAAAKAGRLLVSAACGYDRVFHDESGRLARRVPYGEKFSRPRGWTVKLAPSENKELVDVVRWLFDQVANTDTSLRALAIELNRRGVKSKTGVAWGEGAIRYIVTNPVYVGWLLFGRRRGGKYYQVGDDGELVQCGRRSVGQAPIVAKGTHEALIDDRTFNAVQDKLGARVARKTRPRSQGFVLTGRLKCGHCGRGLVGKSSGRSDGKGHRYYYCPGIANGRCGSHTVRADRLDDFVFGILEERLFSPKAMEMLREAILQRIRGRQEFQDATQTIKTQIEALDRKIAKGSENLLLAEAKHFNDLATLLGGWKDERAKLQSELERSAAAPEGNDPEVVADKALKELRRLRSVLKTGDPLKVRQVVKAMVKDITIWWEQKGKRYHRVVKGVLTLQSPVGDLRSTSSTVSARLRKGIAGP